MSELLPIFLTLSNALSRVVSNKKDVVREFRTMTSYARREINSDLCFNTFPTVPFKSFLQLSYSYFSNLFLDGWIFGKMFEHRFQYYIALPYYLESFS